MRKGRRKSAKLWGSWFIAYDDCVKAVFKAGDVVSFIMDGSGMRSAGKHSARRGVSKMRLIAHYIYWPYFLNCFDKTYSYGGLRGDAAEFAWCLS